METAEVTTTQPINVWCVLVMLGDNYASGAAVVAQTLRNVGTKYPAWCMVTSDVSAECVEFLSYQFDRIVKVPLITANVVPMRSKKQNMIYGRWIQSSFTKWNIFDPELFPVDKVILIDADMTFLKNADELFDLNAPAATFSSPWAQPYVLAKRGGAYNPYCTRTEMKHGQQVKPNQILRGFQGSILGMACMVLVHPSAKACELRDLILKRDSTYGTQNCISGFDEQLLAEILIAMDEPIHHIHQKYNWVVGKTSWLLNGEEPFTQQFYNGKPWDYIKNENDLLNGKYQVWDDVRDWWKVASQIMNEAAPHVNAKKWFFSDLRK